MEECERAIRLTGTMLNLDCGEYSAAFTQSCAMVGFDNTRELPVHVNISGMIMCLTHPLQCVSKCLFVSLKQNNYRIILFVGLAHLNASWDFFMYFAIFFKILCVHLLHFPELMTIIVSYFHF